MMRSLFAIVVGLALAPANAAAQASSPLPSRLWLTAGAASATLHGDCQTCETDYPYRHGGSVLANAGYRVNQRMDVEFEGLGNGELAVLKVPKGWKVGSFTCYSGYWLATVAGPAELQKVESGSR